MKELMACLRDSNATIRWIMLHQQTKNKGLAKKIADVVSEDALLDLLLDLSKFEDLLTALLTKIVEKKHSMWDKDKEMSLKYMAEVAEFFAGNRNWGGEHVDTDLSEYFKRMAETI